MINFLAKKFRINLKESFLIGDSATDEEAARKANCSFIFASLEHLGPSGVARALVKAKTRICRFDNH